MKQKSILIVLCLIFTLLPFHVFADEYKIISTDELKAMIETKKSDFVLLDVRTKEEFEDAHIITAINIPEKSFEKLAPTMLPEKNKLLVLYCSGVKCGKSKRTANIAKRLGYTNLAIYNEGFPVWEEKGYKIVPGATYEAKIETTKIKPEELKKLIDTGSKDYLLIDVRDASEYKEGHIPTAINIPANEIASKQDILPKEYRIIVYCNAGSRSYMGYRKLMRMEYKNINQILFSDWQAAKLPITKN